MDAVVVATRNRLFGVEIESELVQCSPLNNTKCTTSKKVK